MRTLDGKIAIITGGARGIGFATATKLGREGVRIVLNDRDEDPLDEAVKVLRKEDVDVIGFPGDITVEDFGDCFTDAAVETFGGLDIIINNAGWIWDSVIQNMTDEQFQAMLRVHIEAPFRILRAAIRHIRPRAKAEKAAGQLINRKVINVTSTSGVSGAAGQANYASAKAGLIGLTKSLAREWGRYAVNVNCIAFGIVETPAMQSLISSGKMPKAYLDQLKDQIPLAHFATPEDAADAIYLFCLPESDFITGQLILCTGGALE